MICKELPVVPPLFVSRKPPCCSQELTDARGPRRAAPCCCPGSVWPLVFLIRKQLHKCDFLEEFALTYHILCPYRWCKITTKSKANYGFSWMCSVHTGFSSLQLKYQLFWWRHIIFLHWNVLVKLLSTYQGNKLLFVPLITLLEERTRIFLTSSHPAQRGLSLSQ